MKNYWKFLKFWCLGLSAVLLIALIAFYGFLGNYQKVYDNTRPGLAMEEILEMFKESNTELIFQYVEEEKYGDVESMKTSFAAMIDGKEIAFDKKAGEFIEERPVYVVTADEQPVAVVRLGKQEQKAKYGLPLWEMKSVEPLMKSLGEYSVLIPENVTATINGKEVSADMAVETGIAMEEKQYLQESVTLPDYNRYDLGEIYGEPVIEAKNSSGESLEVALNEKEKCYTVLAGGDDALQAELEDYIIEAVEKYAMYVSNDAAANALDKYFVPNSKLLVGIKKNQREWFDEHLRPEIKNQEIKEFKVYSEDAICARVYLEQYMYVPFSGETEMMVTDNDFYFVKQGNTWKISGISFVFED